VKTNGTQNYARLHSHGLTLAQQSAVDLLASGKTDTETAQHLQLARPTVTKWRLYDPVFQSALNQRRAEVWGAGLDRLRSLIPQALEALGEALKNGGPMAKLKAAGMVLGLAEMPAPAPSGATDAEAILAALVQDRIWRNRQESRQCLSATERVFLELNPPSKEHHEAEVRKARAEVVADLEAKLAGDAAAENDE
jgi:hypothetical protein